MKLGEYKRKRDLTRTPEPGVKSIPKKRGGYLAFVVHKHAARQLHYDLRLEMGGVLKSFAVPKGPSMDPSVKRLAMMVEDHPYDYKDFEGVIPKGSYGAGSVIIWDRGVYSSPFTKDKKESEKYLLQGLKKGEFKFVLAGEKLKGAFAMVKTRWEKNSWLLFKEKDMYASGKDVTKQDRSVASGMSLEEVAAQGMHKETGAMKPRLKPMPHNISPMLATPAKKPFDDPDWIYEVKWDGYRAIAEVDKKKAVLYSRNLRPLMGKFPSIAEALSKLGLEAVLDGEIVAVDRKGLPDFEALQDSRARGSGLIYYVFDILYYRGRDLRRLPLIERKNILKKALPSSGIIRFVGHVVKEGVSFYEAARKKGLEGIVAKRSKSTYTPGERSKDWLKIKNTSTQDCVITGFTKPKGARRYFGSLVLGTYEKGKLTYAGRSGGGFGGSDLEKIYGLLQPLIRKKSPFKSNPEPGADITWVKPALVCEVAFTQWTKQGILRHPVFLRMREDKDFKDTERTLPDPKS